MTKTVIFGYDAVVVEPTMVTCLVDLPLEDMCVGNLWVRVAHASGLHIDDLVITMEGDELFNNLNLDNVLWDEVPVFDESVPPLPLFKSP